VAGGLQAMEFQYKYIIILLNIYTNICPTSYILPFLIIIKYLLMHIFRRESLFILQTIYTTWPGGYKIWNFLIQKLESAISSLHIILENGDVYGKYIYIYTYIYMCLCVCVHVCLYDNIRMKYFN
jgi:hypothetical protein